MYVSPAQIRRCELRAGDEVAGPSRARSAQRAPSLSGARGDRERQPRRAARGAAAVRRPHRRPSHRAADRPGGARLRAVRQGLPRGSGGRTRVPAPPGCCARWWPRSPTSTPTSRSPSCSWARAPRRSPNGTRESGAAVTGGSFDRSVEAQAQAAELAVERAKRVAERGGDALVVIDSLESLPAGVARRIFGAARKLEEGGSLTVVAATGMAWEPQRQASTRDGAGPAGRGRLAAGVGRALGHAARRPPQVGRSTLSGVGPEAREPTTPDEELLEAETPRDRLPARRRSRGSSGWTRSCGAASRRWRRSARRCRSSAPRAPPEDDPDYEAARDLSAAAGGGGLRRDHRRRPGDHGGGQPRGARRGRALDRPRDRPAGRAGASTSGSTCRWSSTTSSPARSCSCATPARSWSSPAGSAPSTSCSRRPRCARRRRSAGSRSCCSASDYWSGLLDWLRDPVEAEGKVSPGDVGLIEVTDDPERVLELVRDVEHRRPRASRQSTVDSRQDGLSGDSEA